MDVGTSAFMWGILSAISLPLGALIGLWWRPKIKINSAFMAFGAGALLFALTIELFGHVPHHVETHGMSVFWASITGAILGGLLFDFLNKTLNDRGAFMRRWAGAKRYVAKLKMKRSKQLILSLSRVDILQGLSSEQMLGLIQVMKSVHFRKDQKVFSQNDEPDALYFVIDGQIEISISSTGDAASKTHKIASLGPGQTFGEMGVITGTHRTANAVATTAVHAYKITRIHFQSLLKDNKELEAPLKQLMESRLCELSLKQTAPKDQDQLQKTLQMVESMSFAVTDSDVKAEISNTGSDKASSSGSNAALAIWLGILIDGVPESLVIGMLAASPAGMSLAFVAGVFLANLPEAMSSAVSMRLGGMKISRIYLMWTSITLVTGIGAYLGATLFPAEPTGNLFLFVQGIEGLAAGAMLTMIAETMLPEAFEKGGSIVGLSTLGGFLSALFVKVL